MGNLPWSSSFREFRGQARIRFSLRCRSGSRVLGELLRDRTVTVKPDYVLGAADDGCEELSPLKFLRCRSVKFEFEQGDRPTQSASHTWLNIYKRTIESGTPVRDMRHIWHAFKEDVIMNLLAHEDDGSFEDQSSDWISKIDRMVYDCNELGFRSEKQGIIEEAQSWNQSFIAEERDNARKTIEATEIKLKKLEAEYEKMRRILVEAEKS